MKNKLNLQLFSEGGAGAGASTGEGGTGLGGAATTGVSGDSPVSQGEDLSNVVYGKSSQAVAQPKTVETTNSTEEDPAKVFKEMIKKGGQYHDEFNKYSQEILNKRFKDYKGLQEQLASHQTIMETLAAKYGVDATDAKALEKAINEDNSMFEDLAYKEGLTPEQYRNKIQLERENARLKKAEEDRIAEANSKQIYSKWLDEAQALGQKYGREIDLATEAQNEDFTRLLGSGVSFEAAYTATHFDEMLNGAMAATASKVESALVNKITSRAQRPAENSVQSSTNQELFKPDPNKWSDKDIDEVLARARRGEQIYL